MPNVPLERLEHGLERIREAPAERGRVELIVSRPAEGERELPERASLVPGSGLVGDDWARRGSSATEDGGPNPEAEVTVMSARAAALFADGGEHEAWAPAGDQLFVDLDISAANLPAGTRLAVGGAVLEVTAEPHLGCGKFVRRFGVDAMKLVNSDLGREMRLRGLNARVVEAGEVARGDELRKLTGR
jgi:MOSC domain-containing protein YiiM